MKQGMTLEELAQDVKSQAERRDDLVVDTRDLIMLNGAELSIPAVGETGFGADRTEYAVSEIAHRQIGERLGIPARFYDRLRKPDSKLDEEARETLKRLLDTNVNTLFKQAPERRLVRTFKGRTVSDGLGNEAETSPVARAFLSDRYRPLDNDDLMAAVVPILGEMGGTVISCNVSDTRLYLKVVVESVQGEVTGGPGHEIRGNGGEPVCAGLVIRNSEVGHGSLQIVPMIYTYVCTNGMTVGWATEGANRYAHLGRRIEADARGRYSDETVKLDDEAFFAKVAEDVKAACDETTFNAILVSMNEAAAAKPIANVKAAVERVAEKHALGEGEQDSILTHLAAGGDLSAWGLISAVTRTAQDSESYERASELEALGGQLLALKPREWEAIAA